MNNIIIILIVIIIIALLGIYYKVLYNKIMANEIKLDEALQVINENIKKRYTYVIKISELIKKNLDLDIEQFKEIETLDINQIESQFVDKKLSDIYNLIIQLKEDNPQLENNDEFKNIINDFNEAEEMLEAAKSFYDKYAIALNNTIKEFPSNLVALLCKVKKKPLYNSTTSGFKNEILDDAN